MNDLDDLKAALHEPPDFAPRPLDLAAVMTTGGRIRRRRRLAIGATAGLAVVALLVGGNVLVHWTAPDGRSGLPAAAQPSASAAPSVIRTGLTGADGEWVLYAKPIDDPAIPDATFGLMLGLSTDGGEPADAVMANESEGTGRTPGFHAVQGRMEIDQGVTPTFGYYVGPATKITGSVDGKKVTAAQAPLDDSIQVFWFDAADLTDLTAYAADGRKLPTGNAQVGVG